MTPVDELYEMTEAPESDEEEILLLKIFQSAEVTHPLVDAFATSQVIEFTERVRPDEKVRAFSKSTPAVAGTTEPILFVLRSEEVIPVIANFEVVACVEVELIAVKFWSVVEPVARRLANEPRPAAVSEPVKLAADVMV
jgi:hypothetical protein